MKKIIAFLAAVLLFVNSVTLCFAQVLPYETKISSDGVFEYTPNGVVTRYFGGEVVAIPAEIDGTEITDIGARLCFDLDVSTVYIDDGIKVINENAFEGSHVVYADIPASVTYIGDRAFANCAELTDVLINSNDVLFGDDVFAGTTYMNFSVPCSLDCEKLAEKIITAKGDDNFKFTEIHTSLTESMAEKDVFGNSMFYCEACGFKGSIYVENIEIPFEDVPKDSWYYSYVQIAYDLGIISGKSETVFDPDAGLTCAEAATIAAQIREKQERGHVSFEHTGEHWYDVYVDYCYSCGIIEDDVVFDWDKKATRGEMAYLFSRCDLTEHYINNVPLTDIPDVEDTTLYANEIIDLYNKGIAVGSNEYLSYYPDSYVKRSEAAALVSRILREDMRIELPKG